MKKSFSLALVFASVYAFAQTVPVSISDWKNNAKGAYTIVHDDFGSDDVNGIQNYADTIANNRGVKFTFGAITSATDNSEWQIAKRLMSHGHELCNHSQFHKSETGGSDTKWVSFAVELKQSHQQIVANTGFQPKYFIWPYDEFTDLSKAYLRDTLKYWGGRGGARNNALNDKTLTNFFNTTFHVFYPTSAASELNTLVSTAITQKRWAIRELHGVGDNSWGVVGVNDYRAHCDFIKSKIASKDIWNATALEVMSYLKQAQVAAPSGTFNPLEKNISISFGTVASQDTAFLTSEITVNVTLPNTSYVYVYQNNKLIPSTLSGSVLTFNCFPHRGPISIFDNSNIQYMPNRFVKGLNSVCANQKIVYEVEVEQGVEYIWTTNTNEVQLNVQGNKAIATFSQNFNGATISVKGKVGTYISNALSMTISKAGVLDYSITDTLVCSSSVSLLVKPSGAYEWYTSSSAGNPISSQNPLVASVLNDTVYYVQKSSTLINSTILPSSQSVPSSGTASDEFSKITVSKIVTITSVSTKISGFGTNAFRFVILSEDGKSVIKFSDNFSAPSQSVQTIFQLPVTWTLDPGNYLLGIQNVGGGYFVSNKVSSGSNGSSVSGTLSLTGSSIVFSPGTPNAFVLSSTSLGLCFNIQVQTGQNDVCPRSPVSVKRRNNPTVPSFVDLHTTVSKNNNYTYSVTPVANESYIWSYLPSTGVQISAQNSVSSSVNISYSNSAQSGVLAVKSTNECGTSAENTKQVSVSLVTNVVAEELSNSGIFIVVDDRQILISSIQASHMYSASVVDVSGNKIPVFTQNNTFKTGRLSSGIYILTIDTATGTHREKVFMP